MEQEEIALVCKWAVNISEDYGVPILRVLELYKSMRKFKGMDEVKNDIEIGFVEGAENERLISERTWDKKGYKG